MKPLVYLISPFTRGDQFANARFQMQMFLRLQNDGIVLPFAPLAMCAVQLVEPQTWQWWMDYDLAMLARCDAAFVCAEKPDELWESEGARTEWKFCAETNKPRFGKIEELYAWTEEWKKCQAKKR
jgi:hypothetical protein